MSLKISTHALNDKEGLLLEILAFLPTPFTKNVRRYFMISIHAFDNKEGLLLKTLTFLPTPFAENVRRYFMISIHALFKKEKGAHYLIYYNLNVMQSQQEFLNFFSESKNYDICTKAAWLSAVSLSKIPNKAARRAALFQFLTVLLVHFWKAEHSH